MRGSFHKFLVSTTGSTTPSAFLISPTIYFTLPPYLNTRFEIVTIPTADSLPNMGRTINTMFLFTLTTEDRSKLHHELSNQATFFLIRQVFRKLFHFASSI